VRIDGLAESKSQPEPHCENVNMSDDENSREKWNEIAGQCFNRMGVFACDTDGGFELVVLFVDVFVNSGVVKESMGPIE